jgi:glc operon protein GlcG
MLSLTRLIRHAATIVATAALAPAALAAPPQGAILTLDVARTVMTAALSHAHSASAPGAAVAIVDAGGSVVLLERLDGTFPAGADISIGKARTAAAFHKPTRDFEELINKGRIAMTTVPAVTHFTPLRGGVPLVIAGQIVGGIGVSGAASAAQDDEIAQAGADSLSSGPHADVTWIPNERVAAAFREGATLVGTDEYSVNASRRDRAGLAEIHDRDTDIFYVLSGSAELVTGGEVIEAAMAAPGEWRGRGIVGGVTREVSAGDVLTIPRGTPHWLRTVHAPFTYFVVKATATAA